MASRWPFADTASMLREADAIWRELDPGDWLEAFRAHPRIGEHAESKWAQQEQAGTAGAAEEQMQELKRLNDSYQERFGYIFIICATGKTAEQMLASLRERLANAPEAEIRAAAEEQRQITRLRLLKWHDERS